MQEVHICSLLTYISIYLNYYGGEQYNQIIVLSITHTLANAIAISAIDLSVQMEMVCRISQTNLLLYKFCASNPRLTPGDSLLYLIKKYIYSPDYCTAFS